MGTMLVLSLLWPLVLGLLSSLDPRRDRWWWIAPLPAALLALFPGTTLELPWLLVGMRFEVDALGSAFLLLSAVVWGIAGWELPHYRVGNGFRLCFGLTLSANLGVLVAYDGLSFYTCFSLMAVAAYALLRNHPGARRGARWYLILALLGELALLCAILLLGKHGGDFRSLGQVLVNHPQRHLVVALVYLTFAIKVGNVPLHIWLPPAYGTGHPLAVLVFGGVITNLGVFGWMRFLGLGHWSSGIWSNWFLTVGLISTGYCALLGACQHRPRSILGYSSASQMGLATLVIGLGLGRPDQWYWLQWVVVIFSLHHGLIKTGLIVASLRGWHGPWQWLLLILGALALAGLPPTSGWLAKHLLKVSTLTASPPWKPWLGTLLALSSFTTGLMMVQFLRRLPGTTRQPAGLWIGLLLASFSVWLVALRLLPEATTATLSAKTLGEALPPLLATATLVAVGMVLGLGLHLPEGDLLYILSRIRLPGWRRAPIHTATTTAPAPIWRWLGLTERRLRRTQIAGILLLGLLATLVLLIPRY